VESATRPKDLGGRFWPVNPVLLRPAAPADAEAVRSIYNHEVENTTSTFDLVPRSAEDQLAWQVARSGAFSVVVAELDGEVVGFGALSPYKERAAYRTTVEDSVYVRRDRARAGIGRGILGHLLEVAVASGFHAVMARITSESEASLALHRAMGFDTVGVEREVGRKFGRWLDVVLMQRLLSEPAAPSRP